MYMLGVWDCEWGSEMWDDMMAIDCPMEQIFFMILWGLEDKKCLCFYK